MTRPNVICIGNFDGVHLGHRALLSTARDLAQGQDARVVVITFEPHPNATLDPANQPPRLCSPEQKRCRIRQGGGDEVITLQPTSQVLNQSPQTFIERVVREHRPIAFIEGADFRFGKGRAGDIPMLQRLGRQHGFRVVTQHSIDATLSDLSVVTVRSSVIRWLIGHGRVEDARRCLGQPFSLTSTIVKGEQRGRTIGIPTINLDLDPLYDHMLPADGVYAGKASLAGQHPGEHPGQDREVTAAISVGNKPSFGKVQLTIEAHLLDFDADLYGQAVTLSFTHWLRDQQRFPSPDALRQQLARDIQRVRGMEPLAISR